MPSLLTTGSTSPERIRPRLLGLAILAVLLASGCEARVGHLGEEPGHDAGTTTGSIGLDADAGSDAGSFDAGSLDAGPADAGALDAGPADAGAVLFPVLVAAGYDMRLLVSDDGGTWTDDTQQPNSGGLDNIGTGVAFGLGKVLVTSHTGAYTSTDGKHWTKLPPPMPQQWPGLGGSAAIYAFGKFIIVAGGSAYTSADAASFTRFDNTGDATHWNGIAEGNGHVVVVGDANSEGARRKVTEDGEHWHDYVQGGPRPGGIAFGNGVFVVVGSGGLRLVSSDGAHWDDVSVASGPDFDGVAFGAGKFVSCVYPHCYESTDGRSWTTTSGSNAGATSPQSYGFGAFWGVSWESNIWTSRDGVSWTRVFSGASGTAALTRVNPGELARR